MCEDYLEVVAKCAYLNQQIICLLCLKSKPGHMRFEEILNRQMQILNYIKKGHLCCYLAISNDAEPWKDVSSVQPKAHQVKYAENHIVEDL